MTTRVDTLDKVKAFMKGNQDAEFGFTNTAARRVWIVQTLDTLKYEGLDNPGKGLVVRYICRVTGYSRQQVTRQIRQWRDTGSVVDGRGRPKKPFATVYTPQDMAMLAKMDDWHQSPSGPVMRKLCERAYLVHEDASFERLAGISPSHVSNQRRSRSYMRLRGTLDKTRSTRVAIGERRVPRPAGRPGFVRVDSMHFVDLGGGKGLYLINRVDEVTQFEHMIAVPRLNEQYVLPALQELMRSFPFHILGFHVDNGSEYVNYSVDALLKKMPVELTKSRPRCSNDNGLVESKNGTVIRKYLGHEHIPASKTVEVNDFLKEHLCPYLNFHRPCSFPVVELDDKGRQTRRYPLESLMTPLDKLRSIEKVTEYLKPGVTLELLNQRMLERSANQVARQLGKARDKLFQSIGSTLKTA